jgi:signal transduction histidine kinase
MFSHSISRFDLHHVADFLPYPFIIAEVINGVHQNTFINESFKQDIGYSLAEIPTIEAWYAHAYPDLEYRNAVINHWNLEEVIAKKTGNVYVRRKSLVTCKKGTKKWYEIKASVVDNLHVVAFIDLDNEIRLQEELKKINSNNDRMLSVLGHDLRAPIANLIGICDLALDHDLLQEEFTVYMQLINQQSNQVLEMLETTLNWSRSNFDTIQINPETIVAKACIESTMAMYKNTYTAKNISINIQVDEATTIFADKEIVSILLRNIVTNAIKFTPTNGQITIEFTNNQLRVTDSGVGMTEQKIAEILNNTYTSTRGTANEIGMGMGLQLVQKLAHKIKAELSIESLPEKGSTVQLNFFES